MLGGSGATSSENEAGCTYRRECVKQASGPVQIVFNLVGEQHGPLYGMFTDEIKMMCVARSSNSDTVIA